MTYIKYPEQWQQWLDTIHLSAALSTNQEIIDNPIKPSGWLNPFTEPDKLLEELNQFRTAKEIAEHIETYYPGIDPLPHKHKKIDENKQKDIKYCCTTFIWVFDPVKRTYKKKPIFCKHWNDCPRCKAWKIEQNRKRLERLATRKMVIALTPEDEKEIKANRKSSEYLRIPRADGTVVFILNAEGDNLTPETITELSLEMLPNESIGRYSGKLGLPGVGPVDEEEYDVENKLEVKSWRLRFTDESTIQDNQELECEVIKRCAQTDSSERPHNIDTLKIVTRQADDMLEVVCLEYKVDKQFLFQETIYIKMNEVEWKWTVPIRKKG